MAFIELAIFLLMNTQYVYVSYMQVVSPGNNIRSELEKALKYNFSNPKNAFFSDEMLERGWEESTIPSTQIAFFQIANTTKL